MSQENSTQPEELSPDVESALTDLYKQLHEELSKLNATCSACGNCCKFVKYDHQLWVTSIEMSYLIKHEGSHENCKIDKYGTCPYIKENLCTARDGRALGCRIYHCSMDPLVMEDLYEKYLQKLQALADKHEIELQYSEFLLNF